MKNLIRKLIVVNPENRFDIEKVLEHKWFDDPKLDKILSELKKNVKNPRRMSLRLYNRQEFNSKVFRIR